MSGQEYVALFRTTVVAALGVMVVAVVWLCAWGLQTALVELVARSLGATSIDAWGWGHLAGIPAALELLGLVFLASYLQERQSA